MSEMVGKTIGRYQIQEPLGGGSTAYVYKGIHLDSGLCVAIKILHSYLIKNTNIVERFRRESKVIATLKHPHIVTFYDYYEDDEHFFYVMEYLDASTVEDALEKEKILPLGKAISIVRDVCGALHYAHSKRIIHRDIKPSNIFIDNDDSVILSDFGLAKPLAEAPITDVGSQMMGTPSYMAPEQVLGLDTDPRTDLYQVGLVLYRMLTGELPFQADTQFKAIMIRTQQNVTFTPDQEKTVPAPVRIFIEQATKVDLKERFQTAANMSQVLEMLKKDVAP